MSREWSIKSKLKMSGYSVKTA